MSELDNIAKFYKDQYRTTVFVGVHVIPMDSERILKDQIVIIRDGIISEMGTEDEVQIPDSCQIVMAFGKYLMPGLSDMHVHITNEKDLILFLAQGVTTVQNMWGYTGFLRLLGFPNALSLKEKVNQRKLLGPWIITSGPVLEGIEKTHPFMFRIRTAKQGAREVVKQKKKGYDFIKVYDHLQPETYHGIMTAAQQTGLPVKGHVPFQVGLDTVLVFGQKSIEHLTGYIDPDEARFRILESQINDYARKTREANVWNCPTVTVWQKIVSPDHIEMLYKHPGMRYLSGMQRFFLKRSINAMRGNRTYTGDDYPSRMATIGYKMIKALHEEGAGLLLGTDAGNPFVFPGWSVHEELQHLVNAGLTPFEAIQTGTINAAKSLNMSDQFGTVAVGKQADLILLEENPLEDVSRIKDPFAVMVNGTFLTRIRIDEMLKSLVD